jgi:RHS repeat-associated protein
MQLEAATQTQGATVTAQQAFRFDRIGNITSKQNGAEISKGSFNNRNQLTAQEPGGWMRVRGVTNESSSVRVKSNANPFTNAQTDKDKAFSGWVETVPGPNTLTIEATDDSPNANKKTSSYTINVTGQSRVPTYDLNGNMTANGLGQTYLWDAENRLVKITYADNSKTEFIYDGLSRRIRITERNASNTITSDKRYLWSGGNQPAEERETNGTTVSKRYFPQGEQRIGGTDAGFYYYTKDHLGSIREIIDSTGAIRALYDYDPYGKREKIAGDLDTEISFTGHPYHAASGLHLTLFRAYDANLGRWLSADPLGEAGGINLYGYVSGNPINSWDPLGLLAWGNWHSVVNPSIGANPDFACRANTFEQTASVASIGIAGAAIGGAAIAGPATAYHFTSATAYASIMSNGVITAGSGLFGRGVYVSAVNSPFLAKLMGAKSTEKCIKVATEGLKKMPTLIPGSYRIMQDVPSKFFR